jgi:hypothetical protein
MESLSLAFASLNGSFAFIPNLLRRNLTKKALRRNIMCSSYLDRLQVVLDGGCPGLTVTTS